MPRAKLPVENNGRPIEYRIAHNEKAFRLALLGLTDAEVADIFGISNSTLSMWKIKHPKLSEALENGKIDADAKVAKSLYRRANGYSHKAVKIFMPAGAKAPVYADYTEHYPPETGAATLWLTNRQRGRWKVKTEVERTGVPDQPEVSALDLARVIADIFRRGEQQRLAITVEANDDPQRSDAAGKPSDDGTDSAS